MTNEEKIQVKGALLRGNMAALRHIARHNGAALAAGADFSEVAEHITDTDPSQVGLMWQDINTIDTIRNTLKYFKGLLPLQMVRPAGLTTADLMTAATNDPALVPGEYTIVVDEESGTTFDPPRRDWAVLRLTKAGTEILSCGGAYYQGYTHITSEEVTREVTEEVEEEVTDPDTGEVTTQTVTKTTTVTETVEVDKWVQDGDTELLKATLEAQEAAWLSKTFTAILDGSQAVYSESGMDFYVLPCEDLPGDIDQLLSLRITRSSWQAGGATPLAYALNTKTCSLGNEGMIDLPHGIYLIYDNSTLANAPKGLLVPKKLVDGTETGIPWTALEISYNALVSGLDRLRLVSDAFGEEVIISTQDDTVFGAAYYDGIDAGLSEEKMTLAEVTKLYKDYQRMKKVMAGAGLDVSSVQYVSGLAPILANHVPAALQDLAADLLADTETLEELRSSLGTAADLGAMFDAIITPTDKVYEEDLNA